jgi:hypothetical protein
MPRIIAKVSLSRRGQYVLNLLQRSINGDGHKDTQPNPQLGHAGDDRHRLNDGLSRVRVVGKHFNNRHASVALQILWSAVGNLDAMIENCEPMTAFGFIHVMCGDENRCAILGQAKQVRPEVPSALWVDRAGWLIKQQQFRFVQHRGGQGKSLLLTATHRRRKLGALLCQVILLE